MRFEFTLLVLAVLAVSGCEYYSQPSNIDCSKIADKNEADMCVYNKSMLDLSAMTCGDIMDDKLKDKCIDDVAVKLLDYYPCRQHDKMSKRDACESKVGDARRAARHEE